MTDTETGVKQAEASRVPIHPQDRDWIDQIGARAILDRQADDSSPSRVPAGMSLTDYFGR